MSVEDFGAKAAIEAFDVAVLRGFARFDGMELDAMSVTPCL